MKAVLVLIGDRLDSAVKVQEILTKYGDYIRTRLGLNLGLCENERNSGFLFLEVCGEMPVNQMCEELNSIGNVKAQCVELTL